MIPGSANPLLLASAAAAGGYQIERSLRFNSSDSGFCSRTPAVAGSRTTWTWAGWVKRSALSTDQMIFTSRPTSSPYALFYFTSADYLQFSDNTFGYIRTASVFRDSSAWYHIVLAVDTTGATAADYLKIYVNNVRQTIGLSSLPTLNSQGQINTATAHSIGSPQPYANNEYFNGYLADIHFIDGQALTPSSFTEVSATTGQLIPLAYSGSFGTNGFWLKFSDNSAATAATLGKDYSGNSNNWTPNNLSVTAGAGNDSLVDTPTSIPATDTGVGGEVRGNYCCINPNDINNGASVDLKDGNLEYVVSAAGQHGCRRSTFALSSSKWYAECTIKVATGGTDRIGILSASQADFVTNSNPSLGFFSQGYAYMSNGQKENNNVSVSYGASYTTNDVIGIALDMDAGTVTFYKNGSSQGQAYSGLSGAFCFAGSPFNGGTHVWNFGQRAFAYQTPGTNRPAATFLALCDTNLPAPLTAKPNTLMDVVLYTGTGAAQSITGLAFNPDFLWIKNRNFSGYNHHLTDAVRGVTKRLKSNTTGSELTSTDQVTAYNSNGFSLGADSAGPGDLEVNQNTGTYVAWAWDAGTSTDPSNTAGSITSQVRANVSAGFSVVSVPGYTYPTKTAGHGLGVEPHFIITKNRGASNPWIIYHKSAGANTYFQFDTGAGYTGVAGVWSGVTSTVFPLNSGVNQQTDIVAYCFAPVVGYSSFGSYVGNGSTDGPFVYLGFKPRWIMLKMTNSVSDWWIYDTARDTYNVMGSILYPNLSAAEYVDTSVFGRDILSNGFKVRTSNGTVNGNGFTYIYAAFAENPFQYARAR